MPLPLAFMSSALLRTTRSIALSKAMSSAAVAHEKLASGKAYQFHSTSPRATAKILSSQAKIIEARLRVQTNQCLMIKWQQKCQALEAVQGALRNLQEQCVIAADPAVTESSAVSFPIQMRSLTSQVRRSLNSQGLGGEYLFSGVKVGDEPVNTDNGNYNPTWAAPNTPDLNYYQGSPVGAVILVGKKAPLEDSVTGCHPGVEMTLRALALASQIDLTAQDGPAQVRMIQDLARQAEDELCGKALVTLENQKEELQMLVNDFSNRKVQACEELSTLLDSEVVDAVQDIQQSESQVMMCVALEASARESRRALLKLLD